MDKVNDRRGGGAKWLVLLALVGAGVYLMSWLASSESTHTATDMAPTVQDDSEPAPSTTAAIATTEAVAATTASPATTAAPAASAAPPSTLALLSIAQGIAAADNLSKTDAFLTSADLDDMLEGAGSYTVFAPSNTGFAEMDTDLRNAISADQERVRSVMLNHLVEGEVSSLRTLDRPLVTMAGTELNFEEIDGELFIVTEAGPVAVEEDRIVAANGVVHGVAGVLISDESGGVVVVRAEEEPETPVEDAPPVDEPVDDDPTEEPEPEPEPEADPDPEPDPEPEDPQSDSNETVDAIAEILELEPVQFDDSSADIKAESLVTLDRVVEILMADEATRLEVAGHTDDIGPADGNQRWSERRARSVRDYLIGQGIDPERLVAIGYGENRPIADNATEEGRAQNRRIEFTLL